MNFFNRNFFNKKNTVILFYGHRGWIGSMYINYLAASFPKIKVIEGYARIENTEEVLLEIKRAKPTHVISFTGRTHGVVENIPVNTIDYLEYPGKLVENVRDNLHGPVNLALLCKRLKIHYTYLGTGCIFNSETNETFTEDSKPNYFGSGYSVVKGFTDLLMHELPVLNLRIRMPITSTPNERNFITKITNYERICSMSNSMTVLDDFFPIFTDLVLRKKTGTYNCTNPGTISHNKILELYKLIVDRSFTWKNMTLEQQNEILKSKRSNNSLDTSKIKREYPTLKNIDDSVIVALHKMSLKIKK
jgi:dTDP-4-dehydrorhamnose reductase